MASAAAAGLADLRKCLRVPNEDTRLGAVSENQWHRISISLHGN